MTIFWGIKQDDLYTVLMDYRLGSKEEKALDYLNLRNSIKNINDFIEAEKDVNRKISENLFAQINIWNQNLGKLLEYYNRFIFEGNMLKNNNSDPFLNNKKQA